MTGILHVLSCFILTTFEMDGFISILQMKKPKCKELEFLPKVTELVSDTHNMNPGLSDLKGPTGPRVHIASQLIKE